jgi:hypothetical protein
MTNMETPHTLPLDPSARVMQAFAVCALAWAFYAAIGDYKMSYMDASIRVLFAIVFQLMALTGFLIGGRR